MTASKTVTKKDDTVTELQLSPETLKTFAGMATMIPEAEGSAYDSILSSIFNVTSWDQLDDPWDTTKTEMLQGVEMKITAITRRNSSYRGGLGLFLVVHATDMRSEKSLVWTTGSVAIVGQLVVAYARGWFPLYAELVTATEPTDNGYYPQHLKILGSASGPAS
jgi:hypothetical protein